MAKLPPGSCEHITDHVSISHDAHVFLNKIYGSKINSADSLVFSPWYTHHSTQVVKVASSVICKALVGTE